MLISVQLHFFPTNVVLTGDFSVFGSLTKSEKLSEKAHFSTDCHVNVSLLPIPVGANTWDKRSRGKPPGSTGKDGALNFAL